jgi:hypothetical protein
MHINAAQRLNLDLAEVVGLDEVFRHNDPIYAMCFHTPSLLVTMRRTNPPRSYPTGDDSVESVLA